MNKTPHQYAEELIELSENYSRCANALRDLIKKEAEFYNQNRNNGLFKSDTAVKKAWESTDDGVQMTLAELGMKSISKRMSAIKTLIDVATNEAKGIY